MSEAQKQILIQALKTIEELKRTLHRLLNS